SIANGTRAAISKFASKPTNDICPNTCKTYGSVMASAHKLSTTIARASGGARSFQSLLVISGAITTTPKNAKNDKYQLLLPHKYSGLAVTVIVAAVSNNTVGLMVRP